MNYQNGLTATALVSTLNDPTITDPTVLNETIGGQFNSAALQALAVLGGNTVYFRPSYLLNNADAGLLAHEALHNLGLNDPQVKSALGLTSAQCGGGTDCISVKLQNDCFQPSQPTLLGGPGGSQ
jgi:hypothetical protein